MAFNTPFRLIIDHRIHHKTENYEEAIGLHVPK